jgi:hypothetical protein
MKKMSMMAPLGGAVRDSGAPTINVKNIDDGPLGGDAEDSGAPTIVTPRVSNPHDYVNHMFKRP